MKKKYALVLGGGGARGAYEIGVWSVLRKLGIQFEAVIGTSVGALNGVFIARNDFREACDLWERIKLSDVISLPSEFEEHLPRRIDHRHLQTLRRFRRTVVRNKGLDTDPLRKIVSKLVHESAVRRRRMDFGLVVYDVKYLKPRHIFLDTIPHGKLTDYLMASSALPGFKPAVIDGRYFMDGGLSDNVPMDAALERGYRRLIVVNISGLGVVRKENPAGTETIYIRNSLALGHMLDFSPEAKMRNRAIGVLDTMRAFGMLDGIRFFYKKSPALVRRLDAALKSPDVLREAGKLTGFRPGESADAESILRANLPEKMRLHKDLSVAFMECAALALGLEPVRAYTQTGLVAEIARGFTERQKTCPDHDASEFVQRLRKIDPFDLFDTSRELIPPCYLVEDGGSLGLKVAVRCGKKSKKVDIPSKGSIFRSGGHMSFPVGYSKWWWRITTEAKGHS